MSSERVQRVQGLRSSGAAGVHASTAPRGQADRAAIDEYLADEAEAAEARQRPRQRRGCSCGCG